MTKNSTPGKRVQGFRKAIGLTQNEFCERSGLGRTYLAKIEADLGLPSQNFLTAVRRTFGVSSDWIMDGQGSMMLPGVTMPKNEKPVRGEAARNKVLNRNKPTANIIASVREGPGTYLEPSDETVALRLVVRHLPAGSSGEAGRFGYAKLASNRAIRFAAARDPRVISAPNLNELIEDDNFWIALGDIKGWQFELFMEYLEAQGDRPIEGWLEVLRYLNWSGTEVETVAKIETKYKVGRGH